MLANMTQPSSTNVIPSDLKACKALLREQAYLIATHQQTIAELEEQRQADEQEKEELKLQINELLQRAFGRRSERYIGDPNQLALDFGPEAADAAEGLAEAIAEAGLRIQAHTRRKKRKPRNEQLPEHLPRYEVEVEVAEDLQQCDQHGPRKLIGYDKVETLEFERPQLKVRVTKYPKYICEEAPECGVSSPERPVGLVEGDRYDASIAAEIIANKYGYHLPVYRQQDIFAGSGWAPGRSTLLNILEASAFVFEPLVEHIRKSVLSDDLLGTDDTTVTLLVPKAIPQAVPGDMKSKRAYEKLYEAAKQKKPSVKARMWGYRSITIPLVFFDFTVTRERAGPDLVLHDFTGKIMADCYAAYQGIEDRTDCQIERGACATHAPQGLRS